MGETMQIDEARLIHVRDDIYRLPYKYRGKAHNRYLVKTACSACGAGLFQERSNNRRHSRAVCKRRECWLAIMGGKNHRLWKNGRKYKHGDKAAGHIQILRPDHPNARKGWIAEHRAVVEEQIGRLLTDIEVVHHINCVKDDNRPENLLLCADTSDHHKTHKTLFKCVPRLIDLGFLRFNVSLRTYEVNEDLALLLAEFGKRRMQR